MATQPHKPEAPEPQIDVTAGEWLMIIVTGFTGLFLGPVALIPGAIVVGMFAYRVNPELMRSSKAGVWMRGLLEGPTPDQHAPASTATPGTGENMLTPTTTSTAATGKAGVPARTLTMIDLPTLAQCSTILLVGSRGSGKSTLLRAILAARTDAVMVYDPHAAPTDWPMATIVHNNEASISTGLASAYRRLQARKDERRKGIRIAGWPPLTLAADEWGSIVSSVVLPKAIDRTPGEVSTELLKEGRKFGIGFVAGAHGKTNASLGCTGDQEAFIQSFDWIVNLGGFTRKLLAKEYGDLLNQIPMGTNEQGSTFPLIVVCESPTTGELRLLDMRGLDTRADTLSRSMAPALPWSQTIRRSHDDLLAGLLQPQDVTQRDQGAADNDLRVTAAQSELTQGDTVTSTPPTPTEIAQIATSLSRGLTPGQIARGMKGHNGRTHKAYIAKVEYVKGLIDAQPLKNNTRAADESSSAGHRATDDA